MLDEKTKIRIDSKEPYIKNFNGQIASASDKKGAVTGNQMFDLAAGGGALFLASTDYKPVE